jgi:hypothetical protein
MEYQPQLLITGSTPVVCCSTLAQCHVRLHSGDTVEGTRCTVYMARLRQKIESSRDSPRYLLTEPRAGNRLVTEPYGSA